MKKSLWATGVSHAEIRWLKIKWVILGQLTVVAAYLLSRI